MKKLYYDEEGGEFYFVKEMPKTIVVEWVIHLNCDGNEFNYNVKWGNLKIKKDNSGKHFLRDNDKDGILIYPYRNGQPFFLKIATKAHIESEIVDCVRWGVSSKYYQELLALIK